MSAKPLMVRPLESGDRAAWDELAARHGSIFDGLRWTELFGASLRRLGIYDAGGALRGGFCVWEQRTFGLRIWRNPPYTPAIGPFFEPRASNPAARTDEQRAVVEAMAEHLSGSAAAVTSLALSVGISDGLPFYWRGWKVVPHYTYRIDLTQSEEVLLAAMSAQQRNPINKARKDGVCVEETADAVDLRALVLKTFSRQDKAFSPRVMNLVLNAYPPGKNSACFISRHQGLPIAGAYIVHDDRTAYNLMTGYDDAHAHNGAGPLAMWHAILKAKAMGLKVFDFEGSVVPPIERYFRGFGGQLTPLFTVNKAWLPVELGLKLLPRHRNRF